MRAILMTPRRVDVAVTAVLLLWALPNVPWWWRPHGHGAGTAAVLGYLLLALLQSLPFLARRRYPLALAALVFVLAVVHAALDSDKTSVLVAAAVAAYGVGAHSPRGRRPARLLGLTAIVLASTAAFEAHSAAVGMPAAVVGGVLLSGEAVAARRGETEKAVTAAHLAERARIARELHDVLAHQLTAIAVQAGSARVAMRTADVDPAEVLGVVEHLAREAMGELGHLLGALRSEPDDVLARRPAPGLRDVETLVDAGCAAGLTMSLEVSGRVRTLTPGVELAAYRIVQESVTNAARHAPGARTRVAVRFGVEDVVVEVANGPGSRAMSVPEGSDAGYGRGLVGMRERAELHGGSFEAGTREDGGFVVCARIPCPEDQITGLKEDFRVETTKAAPSTNAPTLAGE